MHTPTSPPARFFRISFTFLFMVIGYALPGANAAPSSDAPNSNYDVIPVFSRTAAPDFTLTDIDGHQLTLSQFRGHVVLLDFWAVDCGGCKIEIPWYVAFDKTYRSRGLRLIGIDMYGESPTLIKPFMAKSGMTYPVAVGNDAIGTRFHVDPMPLTLLIDRHGRIALSHTCIVDRAAFERAIKRLLE
jgi:peroxiredoxin